MFGDLDGKATGRTGGTVDQHRFARLKARAIFQRRPGRHARVGNGGSREVADMGRYRHAIGSLDCNRLGHGPDRAAGEREVDTAAVVQGTYAIGTGHKGQGLAAGVVFTAGLGAHQLA
ncbi:hypothetical protein D9M71_80940 [compost metagenome]